MKLKKLNQYIVINSRILTLDFFGSSNYFVKIVRFSSLFVLIGIIPVMGINEFANNPLYNARGLLAQISELISYISKIMCFIGCILVCFFQKKSFEELSKSFKKIDEQFNDIKQEVDYKKVMTQFHHSMIWTCCKIIIRNIAFITTILKDNTEKQSFYDWFVYTFPISFIYVLIFHWVALQSIQRWQLVTLRKLIKNVKWYQCLVTADFKNRNLLSTENTVKNDQVFSGIGKIFDALYDQNQKMTLVFGWQILCIISMIFVSLTNTTLKLLVSIREQETLATTDIANYFMYSGSFLEILLSSFDIKNESENIVDSLYEMSGTFRNTNELDEMVDALLLQVRHQNVECSIFGMFALDGSLLLRAFESHSGALIVLIQSK